MKRLCFTCGKYTQSKGTNKKYTCVKCGTVTYIPEGSFIEVVQGKK